jgi:hypothetical protein
MQYSYIHKGYQKRRNLYTQSNNIVTNINARNMLHVQHVDHRRKTTRNSAILANVTHAIVDSVASY